MGSAFSFSSIAAGGHGCPADARYGGSSPSSRVPGGDSGVGERFRARSSRSVRADRRAGLQRREGAPWNGRSRERVYAGAPLSILRVPTAPWAGSRLGDCIQRCMALSHRAFIHNRRLWHPTAWRRSAWTAPRRSMLRTRRCARRCVRRSNPRDISALFSSPPPSRCSQ